VNFSRTNSETEREKKGVSATSIRTRVYCDLDFKRTEIHDLGLPNRLNQRVVLPASVVATERIAERKYVSTQIISDFKIRAK
jgi:hypothetical protein